MPPWSRLGGAVDAQTRTRVPRPLAAPYEAPGELHVRFNRQEARRRIGERPRSPQPPPKPSMLWKNQDSLRDRRRLVMRARRRCLARRLEVPVGDLDHLDDDAVLARLTT